MAGTHFIAVDGEGVTHADGTHDYVLLSVGDKSLHDNGNRLSFTSIMSFLYRQHQLNPRSAFVGFYLSYDFSQWLRDIPEDTAFMLLNDKGIKLRQRKVGPSPDPFPVRWNGWEFDCLGMRRFKLRPATTDPVHTDNVYSWMWICDSGPFWQTSFMNAVNPKNWKDHAPCTEDEYRIIDAGKSARSTAIFDATMVEYNVTENRILSNTMSSLDAGYRHNGWNLNKKQWFGPGQAADLWLRSIGAPSRSDIESCTPAEVLNAARCAYYGGWFEIPRHGHVPGTTYEYDINSAYPHVIAGLPCLLHGRWKRAITDDGPKGEWVLAYVTAHGSNRYLGGLPHRDRHGIITRPHVTEGWYWAHEITAGKRAGLIDRVDVHEMWTYQYDERECVAAQHDCSRYPFADITRLYEQRLSIGKNTATGKALKLVYNSAYGKFAQSVGSPKYANALYASLITAGCRTMILDAIATHPNGARDVLMIATDGIYFRTPHPSLPLSDNTLGMWDVTEKENLTLFMPGVYWDDKSRATLNTNSVAIKSRGINARELSKHIGKVDDAFHAQFDVWPSVEVPISFSVITPRLAIARNDWSQCGRIVTDGSKTLSSNPVNKRVPIPYIIDDLVTTSPYDDKGESHPYSKTFGQDIETLVDNDQHITDDGTVNMELVELLRDGA